MVPASLWAACELSRDFSVDLWMLPSALLPSFLQVQSPLGSQSPSSPRSVSLLPQTGGHPHLAVSSVELPSAGDEEEVVKHLFSEPRSRGNPGPPCPAGARWRRLPRLQLSRGGRLVLPLLTQCLRLESGSWARHLQAENLTFLLWLRGQNPLSFAGGGLPCLFLPCPSLLPLP